MKTHSLASRGKISFGCAKKKKKAAKYNEPGMLSSPKKTKTPIRESSDCIIRRSGADCARARVSVQITPHKRVL